MKNFIYLFVVVTIIFSSCTKEEGCTDSLAINFNVDAENDDGSCEYGVVGGEWVTQSITTSGSMTVSLAGITMLDSTINYTETNPDSLEPYKLIFNENSSYLEYDYSNNAVGGGTWSTSGNELIINTLYDGADTTLVLTVNSLNKNNVSLSLNLSESSSEMGMTISYDINQTINSNRIW